MPQALTAFRIGNVYMSCFSPPPNCPSANEHIKDSSSSILGRIIAPAFFYLALQYFLFGIAF